MSRRKQRKRGEAREGPPQPGPESPRGSLASSRPLASARDGGEGKGGLLAKLVRPPWGPIILLVFSVVLYARTFGAGLIEWDDNVYIQDDKRLEKLSPGNAWKIATGSYFANYHPVTTATYALDRAVWGGWIPGFRITQLLFYGAGVVLLYYLFLELLALGSAPPSNRPPGEGSSGGYAAAAFLGAGLYAAHTIHVEAVAWLASRKDVVCLAFFAACLLCYARREAGKGRPGRLYAACLVLAAAAVLSKGYATVLPAVLVAFDACRGRLTRRKLLEKLPFLAVAVAGVVLTWLAQDEASALQSSEELGISFWIRIVTLLKIFAVYVGRTLLPVRLSAHYIVGSWWLSWWVAALGFLLLCGMCAGFFLLRKRRPNFALSIALFLLPLGTVMNLFFTLRIWIADRYLILPTVGAALAAAALLAAALRREGPRIPAAAGALGAVALFSVLTVGRTKVWTGPVELWSDVVRKDAGIAAGTPVTASSLNGKKIRDVKAVNALAGAYSGAGETRKGEELLDGLLRWVPAGRGTGAELSMARRAFEKGQLGKAEELMKPTLEAHEWERPKAQILLGRIRQEQGRFEEAEKIFVDAASGFERTGRSPMVAYLSLGKLRFTTKEYEQAGEWYTKARETDPRNVDAVFFLGRSLEKRRRHEEAYALYEKALVLIKESDSEGNVSEADCNRQMALCSERASNFERAAGHYAKVLELDPEDPQAEAIGQRLDELRRLLKRRKGN